MHLQLRELALNCNLSWNYQRWFFQNPQPHPHPIYSHGIGADMIHYSDVIMGAMAHQILGVSIIYSTVCSGIHQRNIKAPRHWHSPHKGPDTRKVLPFDDVIMSHRLQSEAMLTTFAVTVCVTVRKETRVLCALKHQHIKYYHVCNG